MNHFSECDSRVNLKKCTCTRYLRTAFVLHTAATLSQYSFSFRTEVAHSSCEQEVPEKSGEHSKAGHLKATCSGPVTPFIHPGFLSRQTPSSVTGLGIDCQGTLTFGCCCLMKAANWSASSKENLLHMWSPLYLCICR